VNIADDKVFRRAVALAYLQCPTATGVIDVKELWRRVDCILAAEIAPRKHKTEWGGKKCGDCMYLNSRVDGKLCGPCLHRTSRPNYRRAPWPPCPDETNPKCACQSCSYDPEVNDDPKHE
jgi:hypothetical protein